MPKKASALGSPWPNAQHGEVVGPRGRRCYTTERAAEILGVTDRRVRQWVGDGRLRKAGDSKRTYILATSLEDFADSRDQWPPPPLPPSDVENDEQAWGELLESQGRDLEEARRELRRATDETEALRAEVAALTERLQEARGDAADYAAAAARLATAAERKYLRDSPQPGGTDP